MSQAGFRGGFESRTMSIPTVANLPFDERFRTEILSDDTLTFLADLHGRPGAAEPSF
jgi:hypothetical protein